MPIYNNTEASRYELEVESQIAVADYRLDGSNLIINRVYVPNELRGKGVAAQVMQAVVKDAKQRGLTIVPVCSYAAAYLERTR